MGTLNVLLVSNSPPTRTLGGPGRFVPMLMDAIRSSPDTVGTQVFAYMDGRLYLEPRSFAWSDESTPRSRDGFAKRLYHAIALPSMARGRLAGRAFGERIKEIVLEHGIQIVHAHDFWSAYHAAPKINVPVLFTNHFKGSFYRDYLAPTFPHFRSPGWKAYYRGIEGGAIQRAKGIVFPSVSAQDLLIQDFPTQGQMIREKGKIIYNGIREMNMVLPKKNILEGKKPPYVLNVANHVPDKGIEVALRVFKYLREKDSPTLRFVNVGEPGPLTSELKQYVNQVGLEKCTEFLGRKPHDVVLDLLANSALMIHTPHRVVFDLTLLEAMALGKPIVASDAKGNQEALGEDYPFIFPNRTFQNLDESEGNGTPNTWDTLKMLFDPAETDRWGCYLKGRFMERFTLERMVQEYLKLWSDVN